jgi:hypothetical protein
MAKWVLAVFVLALIGLFPLSIRFAYPLFSRPYEARFEVPVLLVFPDHVEVRLVRRLSEVSPPAADARYTFAIPPARQQWVERQIQTLPPPRPGSIWTLRVRQLGNDTQRIDLEAYRDGFTGMIYDAHQNQIVPIAYRSAGPGAAFIGFSIDIVLSGILALLAWGLLRFTRLRRIDARA